ncbi:hypothetical protein K438DRAFT_1802092 [Mycena galopus ATCC 62051]|nr:hypothetical protein K438DRAFT_1802092 [Mycena galopus ATCC 62051]
MSRTVRGACSVLVVMPVAGGSQSACIGDVAFEGAFVLKKTTELDSITISASDARIPPSCRYSGIFRVPCASQIPKEGEKIIVHVLQGICEKGGQIEQKTTSVRARR